MRFEKISILSSLEIKEEGTEFIQFFLSPEVLAKMAMGLILTCDIPGESSDMPPKHPLLRVQIVGIASIKCTCMTREADDMRSEILKVDTFSILR